MLFLVAVGVYQSKKNLPAGVNVASTVRSVPAESIRFLVDRTYVNQAGERQFDHQIFDEVNSMIRGAKEYVLVDMFLFNDFQGDPPERARALSSELVDTLIQKKKSVPEIEMTVVSDPINNIYGGVVSKHFKALEENGIRVVITDLTKLRDSNPFYSAGWRTFIRWFGNSSRPGLAPHPLQANGQKVSFRSWLDLVNFKANHRKLVVTDAGDRMATLILSANPHDGSSAHSNIAVRVDDKLWRDVIRSEQAVGDFSGREIPGRGGVVNDRDGEAEVSLLTEGAIKDALIRLVNEAQAGDEIDMVMFYLAERDVVKSLVNAANRGVKIRLVLDANKDAFGHTKIGVPNRPVAHEIVRKSKGNVEVRWCDTHGEQCHSKLTLLKFEDRHVLVAGSANLTKRNIGNLNLETNVMVSSQAEVPAMKEVVGYFEDIWGNRGGRLYTTSYETYAKNIFWKRVVYLMQETTGLSSF